MSGRLLTHERLVSRFYDGPSPMTLSTFTAACDAVTSHLSTANPSTAWAVTKFEAGKDVLVSVSPTDAHHSLPEQFTAGQRSGGAHIAVPIVRENGDIYGTLSGVDHDFLPTDLHGTKALLELFADMLARDLDVEQRRLDAERATDSARNDADTDSLTGLWNRRGWNRFVDSEQLRSNASSERGSIVAIDLDGVKSINDNHGHAAGDEYIRRAGAALLKSVQYPYVAARLGGDEFGVIAVDTSENHVEDLIAEIERQFQEANVTSSIGHAPITSAGGITEAWQRADDNMYANKRRYPSGGPQVEPSGFERSLEINGRVGTFTHNLVSGSSYWSPEIYRFLGYRPGEIEATQEVWLQHHHPDDREYSMALLRHIQRTGQPFRNQFRIVDTHGRVRSVLAVGDTDRHAADHVARITGYLIYLDEPNR